MAGSIDLNLLRNMTARLQHRGPDGISFWSAGPVGLAHAAMHTTPESEHESQPHSDELGWYRLTFDGRIDNRKELRSALESAGQRLREDTDAELVVCAYAAWGEKCAARLFGDFAFALWDSRRRQLFCARDIIGFRPFYYSLTSKYLLFASEPRAILELADVSREPNELAVVAHITGDFQSSEETLYKAILRLPPGHCMVANAQQIGIKRYWAPDVSKEVRYSSDSEYGEHFLAVLREAIRAQTRANGALGVFLSGGLDSSSITSLVLDQYRAAGRFPRELATFSMAFPGQLCDESSYLEEMQALWGHQLHVLSMKPAHESFFEQLADRDREFPGYPNGDMLMGPLMDLARNKGIRILLTGMGGDEWLTGDCFHYADFIRGGQLGNLIRQWTADRWIAPKDRREASVIMPNFPILRYGIWPMIPGAMRAQIKEALGRGEAAKPGLLAVPFWKKSLASRQTDWRERKMYDFPTYAQQQIALVFDHPWHIQMREIAERSATHRGIEMRSPFYDRRVIEFALALPEDQRWRGRWTKYILREAMRGKIPESIRTRLTKADFCHLVMDYLLALERIGFFEEPWCIVKLEWVDPGALRDAWHHVKRLYMDNDGEYTRLCWPVWMAAGVELWVRAASSE